MSDTWQRVRRRYRLLDDVLRDVARAGPARLDRWDAQIRAEYADATDPLGGFLVDVQRRWQRAFDSRLDAILESGVLHDGQADAREALSQAWEGLATQQPGVRLVLDAHAGHRSLVPGDTRHRRMLLAATGIDIEALRAETRQREQTTGEDHGREHRAHRGRLRLRPLCRGLHRGPLPAAGAASRVRART